MENKCTIRKERRGGDDKNCDAKKQDVLTVGASDEGGFAVDEGGEVVLLTVEEAADDPWVPEGDPASWI